MSEIFKILSQMKESLTAKRQSASLYKSRLLLSWQKVSLEF